MNLFRWIVTYRKAQTMVNWKLEFIVIQISLSLGYLVYFFHFDSPLTRIVWTLSLAWFMDGGFVLSCYWVIEELVYGSEVMHWSKHAPLHIPYVRCTCSFDRNNKRRPKGLSSIRSCLIYPHPSHTWFLGYKTCGSLERKVLLVGNWTVVKY